MLLSLLYLQVYKYDDYKEKADTSSTNLFRKVLQEEKYMIEKEIF